MTSVNIAAAQAVQQNLNGTEVIGASRESDSNDAARQKIAAKIQEAAASAVSEPSAEELRQAASEISEYLSTVSRSLSIRVDQELDRPIVTVVDSDTDAVVRQIPSEEALAVARFIRSQQDSLEQRSALAGVILNEQG